MVARWHGTEGRVRMTDCPIYPDTGFKIASRYGNHKRALRHIGIASEYLRRRSKFPEEKYLGPPKPVPTAPIGSQPQSEAKPGTIHSHPSKASNAIPNPMIRSIRPMHMQIPIELNPATPRRYPPNLTVSKPTRNTSALLHGDQTRPHRQPQLHTQARSSAVPYAHHIHIRTHPPQKRHACAFPWDHHRRSSCPCPRSFPWPWPWPSR